MGVVITVGPYFYHYLERNLLCSQITENKHSVWNLPEQDTDDGIVVLWL